MRGHGRTILHRARNRLGTPALNGNHRSCIQDRTASNNEIHKATLETIICLLMRSARDLGLGFLTLGGTSNSYVFHCVVGVGAILPAFIPVAILRAKPAHL